MLTTFFEEEDGGYTVKLADSQHTILTLPQTVRNM